MAKFILCLSALLVFVRMAAAQTAGPEKGWLIIDGGGEPDEVKKRFVTLAGGPDANFVLIPTAMSDEQIEKLGYFRGQGKIHPFPAA